MNLLPCSQSYDYTPIKPSRPKYIHEDAIIRRIAKIGPDLQRSQGNVPQVVNALQKEMMKRSITCWKQRQFKQDISRKNTSSVPKVTQSYNYDSQSKTSNLSAIKTASKGVRQSLMNQMDQWGTFRKLDAQLFNKEQEQDRIDKQESTKRYKLYLLKQMQEKQQGKESAAATQRSESCQMETELQRYNSLVVSQEKQAKQAVNLNRSQIVQSLDQLQKAKRKARQAESELNHSMVNRISSLESRMRTNSRLKVKRNKIFMHDALKQQMRDNQQKKTAALQIKESQQDDTFVASMEDINQKRYREKLKRNNFKAHDETRLKNLHQSHNKLINPDKSPGTSTSLHISSNDKWLDSSQRRARTERNSLKFQIQEKYELQTKQILEKQEMGRKQQAQAKAYAAEIQQNKTARRLQQESLRNIYRNQVQMKKNADMAAMEMSKQEKAMN